MNKKLFGLFLCLPLLVGCAAQQERAAKKKINTTCEHLMGCTEEDVVLEMGAPQKTQDVGGLKVYTYHKSYGSRSTRGSYASADGSWIWGTGSEQRWEAYDTIEVFFKDGLAISWKCSVKR